MLATSSSGLGHYELFFQDCKEQPPEINIESQMESSCSTMKSNLICQAIFEILFRNEWDDGDGCYADDRERSNPHVSPPLSSKNATATMFGVIYLMMFVLSQLLSVSRKS